MPAPPFLWGYSASSHQLVFFPPEAGGRGIAFPIDLLGGPAREDGFIRGLPALDPPALVDAGRTSPAQAIALRHAQDQLRRGARKA